MKNTSISTKKALGGWTAVAAGLIAMGLLAYLALEYYQLKLGIAPGKSVCNISSTFNCEVVALSPYASFLGVPMALWGFWTNAIFVLLLLGSIWKLGQNPQRLGKLAQFLAGVILLGSVVMAAISAVKLGTYCLFCMGAYLTSIFAFAGAWLWAGEEPSMMESLMSTLAEARGLLVWFIAIPAAAFLSHSMMMDNYGAKRLGPVIVDSVMNWKANPNQTFDTEKGLVYQGSQNPKVTVVEFIDLLCPHCKVATPGIHNFAEGRPDIRLVVKLYPLDGTCSAEPQMPKRDGLRCQWAHALICTDQIAHKGWPALDWIFDHQQDLSLSAFDNQLNEMLQTVQAPSEEIKKCLDQTATQDAILAMSAEGQKAGVQGTPSIYVNGRLLERGQILPVLDEAYKAAQE